MRKFVAIICMLFLFLGVVNAQQQSDSNLEKAGNLQFEVNPSFFIFTSGSDFDFGPKVELSLRKDRLRFGLSGEYFRRNIHSVEVITNGSLSTVKVKNQDLDVSEISLFGEYAPFNFGKCNPYIDLQAGIYLGEFDPAIALCGGIGLEFLFHISDNFLFKPFIQIGYQEVIYNPVPELNLNGIKSEMGFRFPF